MSYNTTTEELKGPHTCKNCDYVFKLNKRSTIYIESSFMLEEYYAKCPKCRVKNYIGYYSFTMKEEE